MMCVGTGVVVVVAKDDVFKDGILLAASPLSTCREATACGRVARSEEPAVHFFTVSYFLWICTNKTTSGPHI